ncbi:MAG: hypothetical protein AMXMBFR84_45840 [Candidatus Hydrogenedentota bacterium]
MNSAVLIEKQIGERLVAKRWTLVTAESCSGGLIAHRLTNVAGSSAYYLGGAVAYSNALKMSLLGVDEHVLERHGAVSEMVARQMAEGARRWFSADMAVGVTGIAGPGGGTTEKPVGLVYIAVATLSGTVVLQNRFEGTREDIKAQTADKAMSMILEQLS